jgi:membrane-associated phospholipid phosphatase
LIALFCTLVAASTALSGDVRPVAADDVEDKAQPPEGTPAAPLARRTPEGHQHRPRRWNDRRRTVRGYPSNLVYDAARVFSVPNLPPLLIGGGAAAAATSLDSSTVSYFSRHPDRTLGTVGAQIGGTVAGAGLIVGLFSAGRIAPGDRFRSFSYDASQSMLITSAYTIAIKLSSHRERPDQSDHRSFPSGHASLAFSWASVVGKYYGPAGGIPAYTVASLIAVSRLAHHSHYLSDVVAGATLGYTTGMTVVRSNSRAAAGAPAKPVVPGPKVMLRPDAGPRGDGSGVAVVFEF